jgi:4-amino-4-deoxy-L-arabinose transferase-like glycosyltransferase
MAETGVLLVRTRQATGGWQRIAWRPVSAVAAVTALIHLAVATRYGWNRDEFYYVICGRHLAWGYVDQPPLAPLLARLAYALDNGLLPLRLLAVAAQTGCVLLAAKLAAEFGGRRRAQVVTAAAIAACPAFEAAALLFGTTVLDQLAWAAMFVLIARALRLGTVRAWLAAGVTAGVGLENKQTLAVLLIGAAAGLWWFRRDALRARGPWLAAGAAVLLASPDLVWNALHGWPQLRMSRVLAAQQGGALGSLAHLPELVLFLAGPPLIVLWLLGTRWLASRDGRGHRWVLVVVLVAVVAFTAGGGKPYYPAPALVGLFAAGAVRVEAAGTARGRIGWPAAIAVSAAIAVLVGLPVLPPSMATRLRPLNANLMETYGWPQFVDQVARAAATMPPGTVIFTSNYAEAGALTLLGPADGLRAPVYSGHTSYGEWGPPPGRPDTVLCVGVWETRYLRQNWSRVTEIAPIRLAPGLRNQETTEHGAIYTCRQPHGSWAQMWPRLRHLD